MGFPQYFSNLYIGGVEAFKWATPGEQGWLQIESMLATFTENPVIVLGLFSNNTSFPAATPDLGDPNYAKFVADLDAIAEHVTSAENVVNDPKTPTARKGRSREGIPVEARCPVNRPSRKDPSRLTRAVARDGCHPAA